MYNTEYIRNQEKIRWRAITKILEAQKGTFCTLLDWQKSFGDDIVKEFMDKTWSELPEYLVDVVPVIMERGKEDTKQDFKKEMPQGYSLWFDIETSPASIYIRELEELHLSQRKWSISKTTNDELRKIIADWIDEGLSYWQVAKLIRETDPFVFSKSRAELIAVQEIWQAYWFWNYQPIKDMAETGLVFEKRWITSHDWLVRPSHKENEEMGWIPMNEVFAWTGDECSPSKEFRCRCYQENRIVEVKEYKWTIKPKIKLFIRKKAHLIWKIHIVKKICKD